MCAFAIPRSASNNRVSLFCNARLKARLTAIVVLPTPPFPEVIANDHTTEYIPSSQEDAIEKLEVLLSKPSPSMGQISDWTNGTIDRMIDIMTGKGEQWRRDGSHYRTPVSESKY